MIRQRTITYEVGTGEKQDFYTLWKIIEVHLEPKNKDGQTRGGYFMHVRFVQNLGKTKEAALLKARELNIPINEDDFDFNLKHRTKPSMTAFGVNMKYKKEKWYAVATNEFFDSWRSNKEEMKKLGWSCWKSKDEWYMALRDAE